MGLLIFFASLVVPVFLRQSNVSMIIVVYGVIFSLVFLVTNLLLLKKGGGK